MVVRLDCEHLLIRPFFKQTQVLLKNVEIQHKILEEMPLLAAFNGFKQARGRRLSDEDVR